MRKPRSARVRNPTMCDKTPQPHDASKANFHKFTHILLYLLNRSRILIFFFACSTPPKWCATWNFIHLTGTWASHRRHVKGVDSRITRYHRYGIYKWLLLLLLFVTNWPQYETNTQRWWKNGLYYDFKKRETEKRGGYRPPARSHVVMTTTTTKNSSLCKK